MTSAERAIRWSTVGAVVLVAVVAGIASYEHAYAVVSAHGEHGTVARIYPGTIDGLIYAASMVLLDSARRRVPAPGMARWLLGAGIGATLAANILAGVRFGVLGAVVAAWPAPALVGSYELLMWLVRSMPVPECASAAPGVSLAGLNGTDVAPAPAGRAQARPAARAPKRAQAHRAPVTTESAEAQFAAVLAEGRVPSLRQVKDELGVGTDKARQLRKHMENLTRT